MKILIIEDELPAARRMQRMILQKEPKWGIEKIVDSVESAVLFLKNQPAIDLIFMDIQLADGYGFDIFEQVKINVPVIFATAFDEYAVQAFKVNGLDYLLKPIESDDLARAIEKFKDRKSVAPFDYSQLMQLMIHKEKTHKERFLVKKGSRLTFVETTQVAYFQSDSGYVTITTHKGERFLIDYTLDTLKEILPPQHFFQINRQFIVNIQSIKIINTWFNNRLKLELKPNIETEVMVSRERVKDFKRWLDC